MSWVAWRRRRGKASPAAIACRSFSRETFSLLQQINNYTIHSYTLHTAFGHEKGCSNSCSKPSLYLFPNFFSLLPIMTMMMITCLASQEQKEREKRIAATCFACLLLLSFSFSSLILCVHVCSDSSSAAYFPDRKSIYRQTHGGKTREKLYISVNDCMFVLLLCCCSRCQQNQRLLLFCSFLLTDQRC